MLPTGKGIVLLGTYAVSVGRVHEIWELDDDAESVGGGRLCGRAFHKLCGAGSGD